MDPRRPRDPVLAAEQFPDCTVYRDTRGYLSIRPLANGERALETWCPVKSVGDTWVVLEGQILSPANTCRHCAHELDCLLESSGRAFFKVNEAHRQRLLAPKKRKPCSTPSNSTIASSPGNAPDS